MSWLNEKIAGMSGKARLAVGAALIAVGAAGGAGAISMTRPAIVMAPIAPTAIAKLAATTDVVTVKGRVTEVFGDRFVLQDQTGRAMIDAGGSDGMALAIGSTVTAQGRYDNGQLHAVYLIDATGKVQAVGHRGPGPREGRRGDKGPEGPPHGARPSMEGPDMAGCIPGPLEPAPTSSAVPRDPAPTK